MILLWIARVAAFVLGLFIVKMTLLSAIRTFVLPRMAQDQLVRWTFVVVRRLFEFRLRNLTTYEERDSIMAFYAPIALLSLVPTWLTAVLLGYMLMFAALDPSTAFDMSGSSLLTLGFAKGDGLLYSILTFSEATIGLILVALLIAYLPTMYAAFAQREKAVLLLDVRAGTPPTAVNAVLRLHRIKMLEELPGFWESWEDWFAQIAESHTSLPALVFFRSPQAEHSWITAAGCVMDLAALHMSTLDIPPQAAKALCLRAGYLALRRVCDFFRIPYNTDPHFPQNPISIRREEFDAAYDLFAAENVPLKEREQAWLDFAGWRVNYDETLLALCTVTMPPEVPWSSDRAPKFKTPALILPKGKWEVNRAE